jgi:hypothetical protein
MNFPAVSFAKLILCGSAVVALVILIYGQIASGVSFPIVRFRESQPRAFWLIVGCYGILLLVPIAFIFWIR